MEPLSIELISEDLFKQKLEYINYSPVEVSLCEVPEDYYFSSVKFYQDGIDRFVMLKPIPEIEFRNPIGRRPDGGAPDQRFLILLEEQPRRHSQTNHSGAC